MLTQQNGQWASRAVSDVCQYVSGLDVHMTFSPSSSDRRFGSHPANLVTNSVTPTFAQASQRWNRNSSWHKGGHSESFRKQDVEIAETEECRTSKCTSDL